MNSQIKTGSLLSCLQIGCSIIIQLAYTPVMIRLLGQSEYGLYSTVASVISLLSLLSLGFNSGYIRYFSLYKKNNDTQGIAKLNGLFLIIFGIIGIAGLLCGLFLTFNLRLVFESGLSESQYSTARLLMLILTVNLAVSFPMSVFQNIISAHEKFVFLKSIGIIRTVVSPLVTLPLLLMGFRSVAMVTVSAVISLTADIIYLYYCLHVMGEKFIFRDFEKGIFKGLFSYTIFIAINLVIDQINWNVDKLLLGRFRGTVEVAIYSVGYTLYNCYMMFSLSVSGVFTPRIHKIVNDTNHNPSLQRKRLTEFFTKVGRIQFLILALISSGIVFFGKYFITGIWAGEGYDVSYYVALLLIIPGSAGLIQNSGIEIQRAQNRHRFRSIAYAVMALVNLGVSVRLCRIFGAVGSTMGTALAYIIANGIIMNIYYHKKCNIDIIHFWKSILGQAKGLVLPFVAGMAINLYFNVDTPFEFAAAVAVYSLIYAASMWLLGMNDYEKRLVKEPVARLFRRHGQY